MNIDFDEIVMQTENYSGADLVAIARQAKLAAMREVIISGVEASPVRMDHFRRALREVKTSLRSSLIDEYIQFAMSYEDMVLSASIVPCLNCGGSLPIEATFCNQCGTKNPYAKLS